MIRKIIAFLSLFIFLLVILFGIFVLYTNAGLRFSLQSLQHFVPGKMEIEKVEGSLIPGFQIGRFHYQDNNFDISFSDLTLNPNLWSFITRENTVDVLQVKKLQVWKKHPDNEPNIILVLLTKPFKINHLKIEQSAIKIPELKTPIIFSNLQVSAVNNPLTQLNLNEFDIVLPEGKINATGKYAWKEPSQTDMIINTDLTVKKIPLTGKIKLSGAAHKLHLQVASKAPISASIDANFLWGTDNLIFEILHFETIWQQKKLTAIGKVEVKGEQWKFSPTTIQLGDNQFKIEGGYTGTWNLHWQASLTHLEQILLGLKGNVTSRGDFTSTAQLLAMNAVLNANDLSYNGINVKQFSAGLNGTSLKHKLQLDALTAQWKTHTELSGSLKAQTWNGLIEKFTLSLPPYGSWALRSATPISYKNSTTTIKPTCLLAPNQKICFGGSWNRLSDQVLAQVSAEASELQWFATLFKTLRHPTGHLSADLKIQGKLPRPSIIGKVALTGGRVELPDYGVTATDVTIKGNSNNLGFWRYQARILSEKQPLTLTGSIDLSKATYPGEFKIHGENILAMNTPEYKVWATPDLTFKHDTENFGISGKLSIPKAVIAPQDFSSTVLLPRELVIIDGLKHEAPTHLKISSDINMTLGKSVTLSVLGLQGQLAGRLHIVDSPDKIATAYGSLQVLNGTYQAYSQRLKVESGSLNYTGGPIDNPGVNVRATKTVITTTDIATLPQSFKPSDIARIVTTQTATENQKIIVGVDVSGQLKTPIIHLFSEPATLTQSDILSYLVLGTPLSNISTAGDSKALLNALSALNLTGDNSAGILREMQNKVGIDKIEFQTLPVYDEKSQTLQEDTSILLGKALSPRLYLSYAYGMLYSTSTVRLRYQLTDHLSIQSEASTNANAGIDLLYTIETD